MNAVEEACCITHGVYYTEQETGEYDPETWNGTKSHKVADRTKANRSPRK